MPRFESFDQFLSVFRNRGYDLADRDSRGVPRKVSLRDWWDAGLADLRETISKNEISFQDTIATPDITPWLPQVIERSVMEAAEPLIILSSLFERQTYEAGQAIEYPAMGAVSASFVGEGMAYPLVRMQESGAIVTAKVGKAGIAFEMTEEAMSRSRFDIVGMHIRACAKALARLKEVTAANIIQGMGSVAFDNLNPSTSMFGVTHGRDMSGAANASLVLDDLFDTFSQVMTQGFTPDTLIVNPLTWVLFMKDPVLRAVCLAGGNQLWYGGWRGNAAMTGPGSRTGASGAQKVTGPHATTGTPTADVNSFNTMLTSAPVLPNRWPWPLRVVVSPWITFDPSTRRTNIIVCDSNELGAYYEEYGVRVDKWTDMANDTTKVKLRESYCHHIYNEGEGIAVMKNVKIIPNEVVFPAQSTLQVSGSPQPIHWATAV